MFANQFVETKKFFRLKTVMTEGMTLMDANLAVNQGPYQYGLAQEGAKQHEQFVNQYVGMGLLSLERLVTTMIICLT